MSRHTPPKSRPSGLVKSVNALTDCFLALAECLRALVDLVKQLGKSGSVIVSLCLMLGFFPSVAPPSMHVPVVVIAGLDLVEAQAA